MKKTLFIALAVSAAFAMTSCKSQESAYRQAFLNAQANQTEQPTETVAITEQEEDVTITPVATNTQPVTTVPVQTPRQEEVDMKDVRTINGSHEVISGSSLKTYSVVVGSFTVQANASGLQQRLKNMGYDARVIKTNETIAGKTGWFRVIASSFDAKSSAVQSRNELRQTNEFKDAWLLFTR